MKNAMNVFLAILISRFVILKTVGKKDLDAIYIVANRFCLP